MIIPVGVSLFIFAVGLAVGSFLGVLVSRLGIEIRKKKISWKRVFGIGKDRYSYCFGCKRKLTWKENVPLVSYLLLKGKCISCHSPIPFWLPLIEISTGIAFLLVFSALSLEIPIFGASGLLKAGVYFSAAAILVFIFFFDFLNKIILDESVAILIGLSLVLVLLNRGSLSFTILSGITSSLFLLIFYVFSRGKAMGLGDVKFAFFMGLFLGWPKILFAFYLAFLIGGAVGGIMVLSKRSKFKEKIAFGPFLVLGTFISWSFGNLLIRLSERLLI